MKKKFECFILSFISAFTLFFNFKKLYLAKNPFSILNIVLLVLFTFIFYIFYAKNDYKNISKEDKEKVAKKLSDIFELDYEKTLNELSPYFINSL